MRVVIDTNVLLISVSTKFKSYWLFEAIQNGVIDLYISNDILAEYEEKFNYHWTRNAAEDLIRTLLELQTTHAIDVFFRFNLIPFDTDDNKFVDCAVAANADYLITHDKHFNVLKEIPFPKVETIRLEDFEQVLRNQI